MVFRGLPQIFLVVELLTPVPSGCIFTANSRLPLWICTPNPTFQHPASLLNKRLTTQAGMCWALAQTMRAVLTLSCLPQTVYCILLWSPEGLFLSQLTSPPLGSFSECRDLLSHLASWQGCLSLFWFLFSFFLSFVLSSCEGIFLVLLGVQSLLLMFGRCSERIVPFVDVFLMYLWGATNFMSSYSAILVPPTPPLILITKQLYVST